MKKVFYFVLWTFAFEVVLATLIVPKTWLVSSIETDVSIYQSFIGKNTSSVVLKDAENWVSEYWLDSGAKDYVKSAFIPSRAEVQRSKGLEKFGDKWFMYIGERIELMALIFYMVALRISYIVMWLPFVLIIFIPSVIEGWLQRKIKQTNFEYSSPTWHRYGVRGLVAIGLVALGTIIMPLSLSPLIIPLMMLATALMVGTIFSHMQKRI